MRVCKQFQKKNNAETGRAERYLIYEGSLGRLWKSMLFQEASRMQGVQLSKNVKGSVLKNETNNKT
jgi:hypothetical protein